MKRSKNIMKYKDWICEWLDDYVKPTVKEKTYLNYSVMLRTHILPAIGELELEDLTLPVLQSFVFNMSDHGNVKTGCGLSPSTVSMIEGVVERSLNFAVEIGLIERHHAAHVRCPRVDGKKVECFSLSEQRKIEEDILKSSCDKRIGILLCLYTGMRIGELMALRWCDIDFDRCIITVNATCRDGFLDGKVIKIIDLPKTATSKRAIPVPRQIMPYLRRLELKQSGEYVINNNGRMITVRGYQKTFTLMLRRLGIEHRGFHSLRHTFATRALECGMDVKTLADILGHKNPNVTLNRYAHSMMEHKVAMMNRVGGFLQ